MDEDMNYEEEEEDGDEEEEEVVQYDEQYHD